MSDASDREQRRSMVVGSGPKNKAAIRPAAQTKFIVAVDFGTTFTSVAFAHSASPNEVKLVRSWLNARVGNDTADQVPTELYYKNPITREKIWGYQVSDASKRAVPEPLKWFKILLQNPTGITSTGKQSKRRGKPGGSGGSSTLNPARETAEKLQRLHIAPVTVVADFLSGVREVAKSSIERTYDAEFVRAERVEYVLTIPAIWEDRAKDLMVRAAEQAGFGKHRVDFDLVGEPESAATHALRAIQPNDLEVGDTFVVCDAGGGTVDLISYQIKALSPLQLDEVISGSGDLCGSVYLDEGFNVYIRRTLGSSVVDNMKSRSKAELRRTWIEGVKFKFGGSSDIEYDVSVHGVPDNAEKRVDEGFHKMTDDDIRAIFDPIVNRIVELVSEQVQKVKEKSIDVKAILLVGGFGSSEYLLERLKRTRFGSRNIQVLQPMDAQTAIVRGALRRGLEGSIVRERRSPRYYGTTWKTPFKYEPGKGLEKRLWICPFEGTLWIPGCIGWYIKKNDDLSCGMSHSFDVTVDCAAQAGGGISKSDRFLEVELLAYDSDDAPEYTWQDPHSVYEVCSVTIDLSSFPISKFTRRVGISGIEYYDICLKLRLSLVSEVLLFDTLFDGKQCGVTSVQYPA